MRFELTQPHGHYPLKVACLPIPPPGRVSTFALRFIKKIRAKNGTRTRDPNLGKVVLYQLSYFRNCDAKVGIIFEIANFSNTFFIFFSILFHHKTNNTIYFNYLNRYFFYSFFLFFFLHFHQKHLLPFSIFISLP